MRATLLAGLMALLVLAFFFLPWAQDGRFQSGYQFALNSSPLLFLIPVVATLVIIWSGLRIGRGYRLRPAVPPSPDWLEIMPPPLGSVMAESDSPLSINASAATPSFSKAPAQETESVVRPPSADPLPGVEPAAPDLLAWLVIADGPRMGERFRLQPLTTIGRTAGNSIILDDTALSSYHAYVKLEDGRFCLYDKNSTNGTFIYNIRQATWQRIDCYDLQDGAQIKLGRLILHFMAVEAPT